MSGPTLANQVSALADRALFLEGLAGEMLATLQLNVERGYLVAVHDDGKLNLDRIIALWQKQFDRLRSPQQP